jgi:hypothetical protein
MKSVIDMLRAVDLLKRGKKRIEIMSCGLCGQRNRVDSWRIIFGRAVFANCGRCGARLARRVKGR